MAVSEATVRDIETQINRGAPALVAFGSKSPASEAIVAGLVARYGRDAVTEAIQIIKARS